MLISVNPKPNLLEFQKLMAKTAFLTWVATRILPAVREMAEAYVGAVKASAGAESGWCKIRDIIVIPALVSAGIWLAEQIVDKTAKI